MDSLSRLCLITHLRTQCAGTLLTTYVFSIHTAEFTGKVECFGTIPVRIVLTCLVTVDFPSTVRGTCRTI